MTLAACSSSGKPSKQLPSLPSTPPVTQASGKFPMIADTAARLDATKARALKAQGVRTVFRYYSHLPPSIPGKDLQPEEVRIILGEGLSIGSVFQHYNNWFWYENRWISRCGIKIHGCGCLHTVQLGWARSTYFKRRLRTIGESFYYLLQYRSALRIRRTVFYNKLQHIFWYFWITS
jgi:hypothetical protein